jgi:hypothetical protein
LRLAQADSFVVLVDAVLEGGAADATAIENLQDGGIFVRNAVVSGYATAISSTIGGKTSTVAAGKIDEWTSHGVRTCVPSSAGRSLGLAVEAPPDVAWGDPQKDWISVKAFKPRVVKIRDGNKMKDAEDWSGAIQEAIDSGKRVVYFPNGEYNISRTIVVRGRAQRIFGTQSLLRGVVTDDSPALEEIKLSPIEAMAASADMPAEESEEEGEEGSAATAPVLRASFPGFRIEDGDGPVVFEDIIATNGSQINRWFEHASKRALVVRRCSLGGYHNSVTGGKVFFEDTVISNLHFDHQKVWMRQWNPEAKGADRYNCINKGSDLWILGLKTEGPKVVIATLEGGRTEVLGGYVYPNRGSEGNPAFICVDGQQSLSYAEADGWISPDALYEEQVRETRDGKTYSLWRGDVPKRGGAETRLGGLFVPLSASRCSYGPAWSISGSRETEGPDRSRSLWQSCGPHWPPTPRRARNSSFASGSPATRTGRSTGCERSHSGPHRASRWSPASRASSALRSVPAWCHASTACALPMLSHSGSAPGVTEERMPNDLDAFLTDLSQEVAANVAVEGSYTRTALVENLAHRLIEAEELQDWAPAFYEGRGHRRRTLGVDGYSIDELDLDGTLQLLVAEQRDGDAVEELSTADINGAFDRALAFAGDALEGRLHEQLEPSTPAADLARLIYDSRELIGMDVVVAVLADVARDGGRRSAPDLHPEAVGKVAALRKRKLDIGMVRQQVCREVLQHWRCAFHSRIAGGVQVPVQVPGHVRPAAVIAEPAEARIAVPLGRVFRRSLSRHELAATPMFRSRDFLKNAADQIVHIVATTPPRGGVGPPAAGLPAEAGDPRVVRIATAGQPAPDGRKVGKNVRRRYCRELGKQAGLNIEIITYAKKNDAVPGLRNAVVLALDDRVTRLPVPEHIATDKREDAVCASALVPAQASTLSPQSISRVLQVIHDPVEYASAVECRRQHALHVLHHEDGRAEVSEYLQVLHIERLAYVMFGNVVGVPAVPGPTRKRVSLARWSSDQYPVRFVRERGSDSLPQDGGGHLAAPEFGSPGDRLRRFCLCRVAAEEFV